MEEKKRPRTDEERSERPLRRDVPLHRSYGVTRRETVLDDILHIAMLVLATALFAVFGAIVLLVVITLFVAAPDSIRFPAGGLLIVLVLWIPVRVLHKRWVFVRKLTRFCRANHYRLERKRGFLAGLRHSNKSVDFVLSTGRYSYGVCYLTTVRHHSHLIFSGKDEITRITNVGNNKFAAIYGRQFHAKKKLFVFPEWEGQAEEKPISVILCNPAPDAMFRIQPDGSRATSGTGDVAFGRHIYVGSGFLHAVERAERE